MAKDLVIGALIGIALLGAIWWLRSLWQRKQKKRRFPDERLVVIGVPIDPAAFLHVYAKWFQELYQSAPQPQGFAAARYYAVCHAIELALKAFLSYNRFPNWMLALRYGHNLKRLLNKAEALRLAQFVVLTDEQREQIKRASTYYAGKLFEYPRLFEALDGYPRKPNLAVLEAAAEALIGGLMKPCREQKGSSAMLVEQTRP